MKDRKQACNRVFEMIYCGFVRLWKEIGGNHVIVEKPSAVSFLVYNRNRRKLVFVSQHRPATGGKILEAPAGHIDLPPDQQSNRCILETMAREAQEELGVIIDIDRIELVSMGLFTSPGILTEKIWLGYMEIGDADIEQEERIYGLAEEGERIERSWLPIEPMDKLVGSAFMDMKTFALIQWFLRVKYPQLSQQTEGAQ